MGLVRKSFTSHMAYSRERNVFLKLKGTGLGPELLTDFNGYLEYRFEEGESFFDRFCDSLETPAALAADFEAFCAWYNSYREKTNLALGDADPAKFLFTRDGLVCTDFESCRPGYAEQDMASLVKYFCTADAVQESASLPQEEASLPKDEASLPEKKAALPAKKTSVPAKNTVIPGEAVLSAVKLFICVCAGHIRWRPELLEKYLRLELAALDPKISEYLITYMTCSGIVISTGSGEAAPFASAVVAAMPQRFLCVSEESGLAFPGFQKLDCSGEAAAMYAAARQCSQTWMLFLSGDMTGLNPEALGKLFQSGKNGVDTVFFNDYWDHVTPILIRTKAVLTYVRPDMQDSEICPALKRNASVRLLISDNLFLEE